MGASLTYASPSPDWISRKLREKKKWEMENGKREKKRKVAKRAKWEMGCGETRRVEKVRKMGNGEWRKLEK